MSKLACKRDAMRVYRREDLPTRLHFANNRRIEDIIVDLAPGYVASVSYDLSNLGQHGYDFYHETMHVCSPESIITYDGYLNFTVS